MEVMPYTADIDREFARHAPDATAPAIVTSDWRAGLPVLAGRTVTLRELRLTDAMPLFTMLTAEEVTRFISPPPPSVDAFERFILRANRERSAGNCVCFAVVPAGLETPVGLFQVRQLEPGWGTAEWGFALGSAYWGTGAFVESAEAVLAFTFETLGVNRLEGRATVRNGRGIAALRKIGAVQEGTLRRSFLRQGVYHDQVLYAVLADDWRAARQPARIPIH